MSVTSTRVPASVLDRRDDYIDVLRIVSVVCIIFGHWFSAKAWMNGGRVGVDTILEDIPEFWPATWILMTVPVLFFVGGFSNSVLLARCQHAGLGTGAFISRRARRLLIPTLVFAGIWLCVQAVLHLLDTGGPYLVRGVSSRGLMPFAPLWFVVIYLAVTMLTPICIGLHVRYGAMVPVAFGTGVVIVDVLRFVANVPGVGWLNLALVWLLPHQLGIWYAGGSMRPPSWRLPLLLSIVGLGALIILTNIGTYPRSIGGVPGDDISNLKPPTLCIAALSVFQVGLVLLGARWAPRIVRRAWFKATISRLRTVTMSMYLWHMTALLLVLLICAPLGFAVESPSPSQWWMERPVWLGLGMLVLVGIVKIVGPVERLR